VSPAPIVSFPLRGMVCPFYNKCAIPTVRTFGKPWFWRRCFLRQLPFGAVTKAEGAGGNAGASRGLLRKRKRAGVLLGKEALPARRSRPAAERLLFPDT
jgi:hypothetical protein